VTHLIVNPSAGRGRGLVHLDAVIEALTAGGRPLEVLRSETAGHARRLVDAVPDGGTVVAMGGDGTVHELLPACLARDLQLGVVPCGSGDDFAFALGIPRDDPRAAVATVLAGHERRVDVGLVDGHPFVNTFGSGFDADVARRVLAAPLYVRGLGRYLYGILTAMRDFSLATVRIEVEDADGRRTAFEGPALMVGVQNGPRAGGSFLLAPGASVEDGFLDVMVAGDFGRLGTLGILPKLMRGAHLGHPKVSRFGARAVTLTWSRPMPVQMEGEIQPPRARFEVALRPRVLRVLAPPS
jgi:diacylglycerol kinase (ATP)